jgi:hypothetical protein
MPSHLGLHLEFQGAAAEDGAKPDVTKTAAGKVG